MLQEALVATKETWLLRPGGALHTCEEARVLARLLDEKAMHAQVKRVRPQIHGG